MNALIVGFLLFFLIISLIFLALWQARQSEKELQHFAYKHRLIFTPRGFTGKPKIRGQYQGCKISLLYVRDYAYLKVSMLRPPSIPELHISKKKKGLWGALNQDISGQNMELNDSDFDSKISIKCDNPSIDVRNYLKPGLKQALVELTNKFPDAYFNNNGCTAIIKKTKDLGNMLPLMVKCCQQGEGNEHDQ